MLKSMKILDFSTLLPGPYATMMLADLGADVLRVESPTLPDFVREALPKEGDDSSTHQHLNRSKKSITLDLKNKEAANIIKELIKEYDIILEQFRPGVMERLGLDYETLKEVNPDIIYCSLTGYGQTGPFKNRPGHDNNYLSIAGIASYSRRKNEPPVSMGIQIADIAGGSMHSVASLLAAVIHRNSTGEGQHIDISMTDCSFAMNAMFGPGYLTNGVEPQAEGNILNGGTFYDYYETSDGRYFSVGSLEPHFKKRLCEDLGIAHLSGLSNSDKSEDIQAFKQAVKEAFFKKTFAEWQVIFAHGEACVEPVLHFSESVDHPQIQARGMTVDVPKDSVTMQKQIASPIKSSVHNPVYKHIGGKRGANTTEALSEVGYEEEEIKRLKETNVFG